MIVIFDTNVWISDLALTSKVGGAVRFYLRGQKAHIGLPEVVKLETEVHLRTTLNVDLGCDSSAQPVFVHTVADGFHDSHKFVTAHQWQGDGVVAGKQGKIRPADAGGFDADHHFVISRS